VVAEGREWEKEQKKGKDADGVHHHRAVIGGKQVKVMVGEGSVVVIRQTNQ
jgi:hypothetical protein